MKYSSKIIWMLQGGVVCVICLWYMVGIYHWQLQNFYLHCYWFCCKWCSWCCWFLRAKMPGCGTFWSSNNWSSFLWLLLCNGCICVLVLLIPYVGLRLLGSRVVSMLDSVAVATLSGNSLRQTVHTNRASVHQAVKLVAALLRVAGVTAGLVESNGSLPPGLWLTSLAGWLPRTGISSGTLRSAIEYGLAFLLCTVGLMYTQAATLLCSMPAWCWWYMEPVIIGNYTWNTTAVVADTIIADTTPVCCLCGDSHHPITGRLATHPSNTAVAAAATHAITIATELTVLSSFVLTAS